MIIIFENYPYRRADICSVIPEWMLRTAEDSDTVNLPYVGYSFSKNAGDMIFYLPKIFVDEKKSSIWADKT